jgi:2-dehydropantoate 2-reductase
MGTVLGAFLSKAGYDVDLINRNQAHVEGLNRHGAQIEGTLSMTQPVHALLPQEMEGPYDIILLMTKQRHNEDIVRFLTPFLDPNGILCTMQNGIPEPAIAAIIGADRTVGCTMAWGATFHGEGRVELTTQPSPETLTFSIGTVGAVDSSRFEHIVSMLETMGKVTIEENWIGARWAKLLINSAFSGLSVISGWTFGEIAQDRRSRRLALSIIHECMHVAEAAGIHIEPLQGKDVYRLMGPGGFWKTRFSLFVLPIAMRKHKHIRSSMLRDLARGLTTEVDAINGVVSAEGRRVGVPTPFNDAIVAITRDIELGKAQSDPSQFDRLMRL